MTNWNNYNLHTKGHPPRRLLVEAFSYAKNKTAALDLGCGAMNDTRALLDAGFAHVDAVDSNASIAEIAKSIDPLGTQVTFYPATFDAFLYVPQTYDLVSAQYALPFAGNSFGAVMEKLLASVKQHGVFVGNFFGHKDGWAKARVGMHFVASEDEIRSRFSEKDLNMHKIEEIIKVGPLAAGGEKLWHIYNVIASRKTS